MIRFFRQLRKSPIAQNQVHKYLLYAIGEILLAVIGILIAPQIDTWNEACKERRQELGIIENNP